MQIGEPLHVLGYPAAGGLAVNYTQHPLGGFGDEGAAFKIQATISTGNSGGPALIIRNGRYEVAGITSFRIGDFGEVTWFVSSDEMNGLFWGEDFPRVWAEDVEIIATGQGASATLQVRMNLNMLDFAGQRGEAYLLLYDRETEELWAPPASVSPLERFDDDGEAIIRGAFSGEETIVVNQPLILDHPGDSLGIAPESLIYGLFLLDPESEDVLWGEYDIPLSYGSAQSSTRVAPEPYAVLNGPLDPVISGVHTFDWSAYNHQLQENQAYSIVFWDPRKGETPLEDGVTPTGFVRSTSVQIDLNQVIDKMPEIVENEYYRWGVILIQTGPSFKRLAYLGGDHKFWLTRGSAQAQSESTAVSDTTATTAPESAAPESAASAPAPSQSVASSGSIVTEQGTFTSIQSAIDAAPAGSTITLPAGTYYENLKIDKEIHLMGSGNGSDVTIIGQDDHTIYFNAQSGTLYNLTLGLESDNDNTFAIRTVRGQLLVESCDISSDIAGIGISSGANPTVRNSQLHDMGIAIFAFDRAGGILDGNEIYDNFVGIGVDAGSNPTVRGNQIYNNEASGIAISNGGQGIFEDNVIYGHGIAGASIEDGGNPLFRNNQFYDNAISAIMISEGGRGFFEGNSIYENPLSGIAVQKQGDPTVRSNSVYDNGVGIIILDEGLGTYERNDIYANITVGIVVSEASMPIVRDNRVSYNRTYGISIDEGGGGTYMRNDLTNNQLGSWQIEDAGPYEASDNIE